MALKKTIRSEAAFVQILFCQITTLLAVPSHTRQFTRTFYLFSAFVTLRPAAFIARTIYKEHFLSYKTLLLTPTYSHSFPWTGISRNSCPMSNRK